MDPPAVRIEEPAMLIRISQLYDPAMSADELYDATRGHWKVGPRRDGAELAMAVADGIVREVFRIESWHRAGTTPYRTQVHGYAPPERWEFVGKVAEPAIRTKYRGRSVKGYFTQGAQTPFRYVNC